MKNKSIVYEEGVNKLSELLENLKKHDISLDEKIKYYEEGITLYKELNKILEEKENKILSLNKDDVNIINLEDSSDEF